MQKKVGTPSGVPTFLLVGSTAEAEGGVLEWLHP